MEAIKDYILTQVSEKKLPADQAARYLQSIKQSLTHDSSREEYAIIGMALRFPTADTPDIFWENLMHQRDSVGAFPKNRIDDVKYVNKHTYDLFNGFQCRVGSYLDRIDLFDHSFFKITPAEARVMDPSQRIFLEVAVEAIENAGLTEEDLRGSNTGIFVGYSINEDNYIDILPKDDPNVALGNQPSILAYRLSFLYDMRGPTMVLDTACSSSLVAVHQACQAIALHDCDQAIVGGVNVRIFPAIREISNLGIEAFDGRCKTFDAKANGTNIGDGVAAIIIKRKELAEKDGDHIYAIIKGSAVNSDGNANGITAPNPEAQAAVLQAAWTKANIDPREITFIETHGTGTKLGDPIEVLALTHAFSKITNQKQFCPLGAVKTNIGHLEATSGIAGLIKAVLALVHRQLPPNIHYQSPNPYIDFQDSAVFPAVSLIDWKNRPNKLLAGISSFGISGTNCHLVIEEYNCSNGKTDQPLKGPFVFLFSVKQKESLVPLLEKYLDWFKGYPTVSLNDFSYTLACARNHYDFRVAFVADHLDVLIQKMQMFIKDSYLEEQDVPELVRLYLQKAPIYWKRYFPSGFGKKIPLPTYAFSKRRHWPKLEIAKTSSVEERLKTVFYELEWKEETLLASKANPSHHHQKLFLFFIHPTEVHEAFANFVEAQGVLVYRVYPSNNFAIDHKKCYINADSAVDYDRLMEWVLNSNSHSFGGILHLWDCIPFSKAMKNWEEIQKSQIYGAASTFYLIRALQRGYSQGEWKLINLTSHAQKVNKEPHPIDPTRMPVLGINKVVSQEMPLVQSLTIDLELTPSLFLSVFQEIFSVTSYNEAVVAYRENKRYVQTLSRKNVECLDERKPLIRKQGVYLIAGGAGYLGLTTAHFLAEKEQVRIVLTGRSSEFLLTEKQKTKIKEIEKLGSEIVYLKADVTDFDSCKELIEIVEKKWGIINGVFVAIKNISHKRLENVLFEEFNSNILAKIQGTWLLDFFTRHMPIDFMANFSSISSLTGGPTGADCSASNLFLDSFGDWRNDEGRETITMNYTLIEADDGSLLSDRMSMIPPLSKEEFLACLNLCMTKNIDFAVMADFNSRVMSLVLPFMKIKFSSELSSEFQDSKESIQGRSSELKSDMTFDEITMILQEIWKDVLGHEEINAKANFFEIGGDSISAVKLLHLMNVQLQLQLEISALYSYPILKDLAFFIAEKLSGKGEQKSLSQLLEDFQSGKIDINQTVGAYEQIH